MTVSRVLNNPALVEESTRERVKASIQELDYVANKLAFQVRTGSRPSISILALNLTTTPYSVDITLTIEQVAREHGWMTYIVNTFSNDPSSNILDALLALRPDGVIFATMGHRIVKVHERLIRVGVVLANCRTTHHPQANRFAYLSNPVPFYRQGILLGLLPLGVGRWSFAVFYG
jgi:DNA-binding LacI/PurR family transcriptional regulator